MGMVSRTQVVKFIRKGDPGDKGEKGAVLRGPQAWSDCATGFEFKAGSAGETWFDVVVYGDNYYTCKKSHAKTSSNYPGSTADVNNGYWQLGDKIALVATRLLLAEYALVKNLGVETVEMTDSDGNVLFQVKDGNVVCKTGTFENVVISGTLEGVSGSFKSLNCIDGDGNVVGNIAFGSDGKLWFAGDMYHQGYQDKLGRSYRFYTSDVWCRGDFGARSRCTLVVKGSYGYYYSKGLGKSGVYVSLKSATSSAGDRYYTIPMYGLDGDYAGMPVDTVVFSRKSSTALNYLLSMAEGQRAVLINACDDENNTKFYVNGSLQTLGGGHAATVANYPSFMLPSVDSTVLGRGIFIVSYYDNGW